MTTIAYNHKKKEIAVDGRTTKDMVVINDNSEKFVITEDYVIFIAGSVSDIEYLLELVDKNQRDAEFIPRATAFLVKESKVYTIYVDDRRMLCVEPVNENDAIGSGEPWAIAAMDFGKTTKAAVEYAASKDTCTGGKITVFNVKKMEFVNG